MRLYSEFSRVDPYGMVVPADRGREGVPPREILSPALVRNGHTSFHVVVNVPAGQEFSLFVVQNPYGALDLSLYQEKYERRGAQWIPDALRPLPLEYTGRLPDPAAQIENQTHMSFLLDIFVPPKAAVRRYRVEAQLLVQGRYIICPMEVRVVNPVPKDAGPAIGRIGDVGSGADVAAASVVQAQICGTAPETRRRPAAPPLTVRGVILRNARQDMSIARALSVQRGSDVLAALFGLDQGREAWCRNPSLPARDRGAEWYLRVRDHLYRLGKDAAVPAQIDPPPELKVPVVQ